MKAYFHIQREKEDQLEIRRIPNLKINVNVHFHSQIELYIIVSGKVDTLINGNRKTLSAGEIAVSLSNDTHGYRSEDTADVIYMIIPLRMLGDLTHLIKNKHSSSPFINSASVFETVLKAYNGIMDADNELLKRGYLYVILGTVLEEMKLTDKDKTHDLNSEAKMLIYISENYKKKISLSHLSEKFGYNPSYISGYFKKSFGISLTEYLSMLRLREAICLLDSGAHTVTECALESGFGSTRSFYRAFQKEFNCSPKNFCAKK